MRKLAPILIGVLILGALLWNGWVFGYLGYGLAGYLHMSISELEALGQPHATLFNALEDASGLLMIIGALGLIVVSKRKFSLLSLILITITAVGGLTLYDVAHPLDCNTYHNPVCLAKLNAHQVSQSEVRHDVESRITSYVTILLALLIVVWAYIEKVPQPDFIAVVGLAIGVVITLTILDISTQVALNAISERLWNVLVSLDIGFVGLGLRRERGSAYS